jgi:hypothetical protein
MFTTLPDLLPSSSTIPIIESASESFVDNLMQYLPPTLFLLEQDIEDLASVDPNSDVAKEAIHALSLDQKKSVLGKVLRSPQFSQSLGSLTMALRDGGLPSIADALGIEVENGGFMRGGGVALGGGDAIEAFINGVKRGVEKEDKDPGRMDTD